MSDDTLSTTVGRTFLPAGFADCRLSTDRVRRLLLKHGSDIPEAAELMRVAGALSRSPAGSFESLRSLLHQDLTAAVVVAAVRDAFIGIVDDRLQALYQAHFAAHPPDARASHTDKVDGLSAVREDAERLVAQFDWEWLSEWLGLASIGEDSRTCLQRLSNFAFECRRVNFRFTYHCNISCRHCYNDSGPHAKAGRLDLPDMLAVVDQMPDAGIDSLNLTGGEPFLYLDDVLALIRKGRSIGLRAISIYTNGFWATSAARTEEMLSTLADAGFMVSPGDHLKVSAGVYHQEFIEFARILTLADRYYRVFGKRLLVDYELATHDSVASREILGVIESAGAAEFMTVTFRRVSPLGRGRLLDGYSTTAIGRPCGVINQIVFDADGTARPCCGFNNDNQGIRIGRIRTHSLRRLIKNMQNDPLLQLIATQPMSQLFDHVEPRPNPAGYAGTCALCQAAVGGLVDKAELQARLFTQQAFYPFWFSRHDVSQRGGDLHP